MVVSAATILPAKSMLPAELLSYGVGIVIGILVLYFVIRSAVGSALYRHQVWLEQYRPETHPRAGASEPRTGGAEPRTNDASGPPSPANPRQVPINPEGPPSR